MTHSPSYIWSLFGNMELNVGVITKGSEGVLLSMTTSPILPSELVLIL